MLKFNNYPPQEPGDVELTESFKRDLRISLNPETTVGGYDAYAYGKVLGHILVANLAESDRNWPHSRKKANELAAPIFDEIDLMTESTTARIVFDDGYNTGLMAEALNLRAEGTYV